MRKGTTRLRLSIILIIYIITIIPLATYGIQKINFVSAASGAPTLMSPNNGGEIDDTTPLLAWSSVSGIFWTQIQVDEFNSFISPNTVTQGSSNTVTWTTLSDDVYYWRVRVTDDFEQFTWGPYSTIWSFEVDTTAPGQPSLVAPTNGYVTTDSTPYFDWGAVNDGVTYEIEVCGDIGFDPVDLSVDDTTSNTYYTSPFLSDGTYYWRVRAQDVFSRWGSWSSIWSIIIDTTIPTAPNLVSPIDDSAFTDNTPTLDWSVPTHATQYEVEVNTQDDFLGTMVVDTIVPTISQYTCLTLSDDDYYWRVRAGNSLDHFGSWSTTWSFTVAYNAPAAPILTSPSDGTTTSDTTPTLTWASVYQGVNYQVQVNNGGGTILDTTTPNLYYTCITLPDDAYQWRVRAQNIVGTWGAYSSYFDLSIDTSGPVISDLTLNPTNPSDVDSINFSCNVFDDSGLLEVRFIYRVNGGTWINSIMSWVADDNYTYALGSFSYNDFVEYYVTATDNSPGQILSVEDNGGIYYSFTVTSGDLEGPTITDVSHLPETPIQIDDIIINATVTDINGIHFVYLYYRIFGGEWSLNIMTNIEGSIYQYTINPFLTEVNLIEYYIYSEDNSPNENNATDDNSGVYYQVLIDHVDTTGPGIGNIILEPVNPNDKQNVTIICSVFDQTGIDSVKLYYRIDNGTWFNSLIPHTAGEFYVIHLLPFNGGSTVDYYIEAIDSSPLHNVAIKDNSGNYYSFTVIEITFVGAIDPLLPMVTALGLLLLIDIRRRKQK